MKVKDLTIELKRINLTAVVIKIGKVRDFEKGDRSGKVADGMIEDETGSIAMTFWNDETKLNVGDKIEIVNGYTYSFGGELVVSAGKYGKLTKLEK